MSYHKPIIGLLGGIGAGKSFVAGLFAEMGCLIIDSDHQVALAYQRDDVKGLIWQWWGNKVLDVNGDIDRTSVAQIIFNMPEQRRRLEELMHPIVAAMRDDLMKKHSRDPEVVAFVWDTPLLAEIGLDRQCDSLVFVEASDAERRRRVASSRHWKPDELTRREKLQMPLDKKRKLANYIIRNTAGADDEVRSQVRETLSQILAKHAPGASSLDACEQPEMPFRTGP